MKFYPETAEKGRKCLNSSGSSQPVLNSKYLIKELDYETQKTLISNMNPRYGGALPHDTEHVGYFAYT